MELEDQLKSLLASCTWVRDADTALRVVPSLGADLPVLTVLTESGGRACLPVACSASVVNAVTEVLRGVLPAAVRGEREPIHDASREQLLADPLVSALASLMIETLGESALNNRAIPALTTAWAIASVMGGGSNDPILSQAIQSLSTMAPNERATAMSYVSWSMNGRLAAAGALLRRAGYPARVGGLARALLTTPLALCVPLGSLRSEDDYALAAQIIGVDVSAALLAHLRPAVDAAFAASRAQVPQRPVDHERAALRRLGGDNPLFAPGIGPRVVALLPELIDAKALAAAGIPADIADGLCDRRGAAALASAWSDLLTLLLRWDVLSAIIAAVQPLRRIRGRWRVDVGDLPSRVSWSLLSPRGPAHSPHTIVAVRLSSLRAHAQKATGLAKGAADRTWASTAASLGGGTATIIADHGIAVFQTPSAALMFALAVLPALRALRNLELKGLGEDIPLPSQKDIGVGIATGQILGGTDGRALSISGPAVADAIALAGSGPLEGTHSGSVRSAGPGPAGFHNSGVVSDDATLQLLITGLREANSPIHVQGEGGMAGGLSVDFKQLPFRAWWEAQNKIVGALSISALEPGASELLTYSVQDFAALHKEDSTAKGPPSGHALRGSQPIGFSPASEPAQQADPFASDPFSAAPPAPPAAASPSPSPSPADPFQTPTLPPPSGMSEDGEIDFDDPFAETEAPAFSMGDDDEDGFELGAPAPLLSLDDDDDDDEYEGGFAMPDSELGFSLPTDEPEAPMSADLDDEDEGGFDFVMPDDASAPAPPMLSLEDDDDDDEAFSLPEPPSPPQMTFDDEYEDDGFAMPDSELGFSLPTDEPEAPMILDPDDEDGFDFAMPGDAPAPPMLSLEDDELGVRESPEMVIEDDDDDDDSDVIAPAPPMMIDDDDDEEIGFGLLQESEDDDEGYAMLDLDDEDDFGADMPTQRQRPPLAPPMLLEDEPSGLFEPLPPEEAAAPTGEPGGPELLVEDDEDESPTGASAAFMATDIAKMFQGYVVVGPTKGMLTFGLLDDHTLRDAHSYPSSRDPHNAYVQFLMDKMREGFVPQVHRTQNIEGGPAPLDMVNLEAAYDQMMGR